MSKSFEIQLMGSADSEERLSFLTAATNKVNNPNSQDAYVYATVAVATVKLELKDLEGARKDLDKSEKILDNFDSVETIVHAAFYRVNAEYYQVCLHRRGNKSAANKSSLNSSLRPTTGMPSSTLRVSKSPICHPPSAEAGLTILLLLRWSQILFTTSVNCSYIQS